jgi:hypothetical protein
VDPYFEQERGNFPEEEEEVGPYRALADHMAKEYLPKVVGPIAQGWGSIADVIAAPAIWAMSIGSAEERKSLGSNIAASIPRQKAMFQHTLANMLSAVEGPLQRYGDAQRNMGEAALGRPMTPSSQYPNTIRDTSDAIRLDSQRNIAAANVGQGMDVEGRGEVPFAHQLAHGFASAPGALAEAAGSVAIGGPAGLPALMALKYAFDDKGGNTGTMQQLKGAAFGTAMHMIAKGSAGLATPTARAVLGGAGFGGLAAIGGGTNEQVAEAAIVGGALTAMMPGRRDSEIEYMHRKQQIEAEYRLNNGREVSEQGVGRPGIDREGVEPPPGEAPPEGAANPRNEIELWQETMQQRRIDPNTDVGRWARDLDIPNNLPSGLEVDFVTEQMMKMGGSRAVFESMGGTRTYDQVVAESRALVERVGLQESPDASMLRQREGRGWDDSELFAAHLILQKRFDALHDAKVRAERGEDGAQAEYIRAFERTVETSYALESGKRDAGRSLQRLKDVKADQLRRTAERQVEQEARESVMGDKKGEKGDPTSDRELVEKYGGTEEIANMMSRLGNLSDPAEVMSVLRVKSFDAHNSLGRQFIDIWLAGLLSAPQTHMGNIGSGAMYQVLFQAEQVTAAAYGIAELPFRMSARAGDRFRVKREAKKEWDELTPEAQEQMRTRKIDPESQEQVLDPLSQARDAFIERRVAQQRASESDLALDRVTPEEVIAGMIGSIRGANPALGAVQRAWETGAEFSIGGVKSRSPFDAAHAKKSYWPFKALTAEDALAKSIAAYGRLHELGMREAKAMKIPWGERAGYIDKFVQEVLKPPRSTSPQRVREIKRYQFEALDRAELLTFTQAGGKRAKAFARWIHTGPEFRSVFSFFETPLNVTKQVIYRTPGINLVAPKNWADIAAGGERRGRAMARMTVASVIAASMWNDEMQSGEVTGASNRDPRSREIDRSRGVTPFSFMSKTQGGNDMMQSFAKLEPLATPIAVTATIKDWYQRGYINDEELGDIFPLIVAALAENITNKSMLQGPQQLFNVLAAPDRNTIIYSERMLGSLVPSLSNAAARSMDPQRRDQSGLVEAVMARVPWLRDELPVMWDLAGRPYKAGDPDHEFFARMFSEYKSEMTPTMVLDAMEMSGARIDRVAKDLTITPDRLALADPPRSLYLDMLGTGNLRIELSPIEREYINGNANKKAHDHLLKTLPKYMKNMDMDRPASLDVLRLNGAPAEVIDQLRYERIKHTTMKEIVKRHISDTYRFYREGYTQKVVNFWMQSGQLRTMSERAIMRQDKANDSATGPYRSRHRAGAERFPVTQE